MMAATLCLRTSLVSTTTTRLAPLFISPTACSPLLSPLRCKFSTQTRSSWRNPTTSSLLLPAPFYRTTPSTIITKPTQLQTIQLRKQFHTTRPLYAWHAFRLANFMAPILMRHIRTWIGTPKTNVHFFRRLLIFLGVLLGIPTLYIYTHLEPTPYTDRVRFVALTSEDEHKIAELAFNELVDTHEADFIPEHHRLVSHVTDVAERIIAACDRPDINWEVQLVDSPIRNAFAIPGGKIFVFSGILDVTQNEDGLAFILGHEVAHVLARHSAEQMTLGRLMFYFSVCVSAVFGDNIGSFFLHRVISLLTELRYSRHMESEADYIGLVLMDKAKYNINEAPRVWERMMQTADPNSIELDFLSTHPSDKLRIKEITKWVEEIKEKKKNNEQTEIVIM